MIATDEKLFDREATRNMVEFWIGFLLFFSPKLPLYIMFDRYAIYTLNPIRFRFLSNAAKELDRSSLGSDCTNTIDLIMMNNKQIAHCFFIYIKIVALINKLGDIDKAFTKK